MPGIPLIKKSVEYSTLCSVDRVDNTKCDIFLEASNVIVFDLCVDPVHNDFGIHCANNLFFACTDGVSFCPYGFVQFDWLSEHVYHTRLRTS
jgi:hypothetical protein